MKIKLKTLIALLLLCQLAKAQSYVEEFSNAFKQNDTLKQRQALLQWDKAAPNDPQRYVNWFNYYVFKGRIEVMALEAGKGGGDIQLQDSTKKVVANMHAEISYDEKLMRKGIAYLDAGIAKYPDRLDMRFGKTYILGQTRHYNEFTAEIIKAFTDGEKIGMKWKWTGGQPISDPVQFILSTEQDYIVQLYNAGPSNIKYIKQLGETALKYYPDNVPNLSNMGIVYIEGKEYDNALKYLLRAEKITPQDPIVLNNIALCYASNGDKATAIKYYELKAKYGNDADKKNAAARIAELKKQE